MAVKRKTANKRAGENKTKPTAASVDAFIAAVPNEMRRKDARAALALMKKATGERPKMWGPSIVGFGAYHYKYASGREGDACLAGFSPRANATVFYVTGSDPTMDELFAQLGKYKRGKACVYVSRLADIDLAVLEKIVAKSVAYMRKTYAAT